LIERKSRKIVGWRTSQPAPDFGKFGWDGNHGLENAILRPLRTENKELRWLFSVPGDGHLAYSMLFSDPGV